MQRYPVRRTIAKSINHLDPLILSLSKDGLTGAVHGSTGHHERKLEDFAIVLTRFGSRVTVGRAMRYHRGSSGCATSEQLGPDTMKRKTVGIGIIVILAAAILFGTVGSVMEVVAATSAPTSPTEGEYVARLAPTTDENPALEALKYACPFH